MISRKRHAIKAVTWRMVATSTTVLIAWWVTGDFNVGLEVGAVEFFAKLLLYYLHERFWYKFVGLGVRAAQAE
ncbi:MAG: DUF2061 domain-containing protein [Gemmatimonadetes bacterium]|jgi:uncharacterized membrane protein|nr:DUF2061 domain-containing protein [Gemmatimonadota bacterium]MCH8812524.1 DUF2061 domain-containing protein [Gemmatimonadota bacterium]